MGGACGSKVKFQGLGGKGTLVDVGGEPFNHDPLYNSTVKFDMAKVCSSFGRGKVAMFGAGALNLLELLLSRIRKLSVGRTGFPTKSELLIKLLTFLNY